MIYQTQTLSRFILGFRKVKKLLTKWWLRTEHLPHELKQQARLSIKHKTFHCLGGSIYAHYPRVDSSVMLQAIVTLQTISDYLDNLCDRMSINDDLAFRQLHLSFTEALDPDRSISEYYRYYPYNENTYLVGLVRSCRAQVKKMPYYQIYKPYILRLASNYCELQVLKHLVPSGESVLKTWVKMNQKHTSPPIFWNEWAAATGSTLGIFMLFAASYHCYSSKTIELIYNTYFPWIHGLHILLDYYIDRLEDHEHQDLNFTFYYPDIPFGTERLRLFSNESQNRARSLPHSAFHDLVIKGLIAMYGSDPKLKQNNLDKAYRIMLSQTDTRIMFQLAKYFRYIKHLN